MTTASSHSVKFYEDDALLVESVSTFIMTGLQAKGSVIVLTTARHRMDLEQAIAFGVLPVEGKVLFIDAHDALSRFMVDGWPDETRFLSLFEGLLVEAARQGPVRIFGEMVAILWAEGHCRAALRLEQLWNLLARRCAFSLLCAYPLDAFVPGPGADAFLDVCSAHDHILVTASNACQAAREA